MTTVTICLYVKPGEDGSYEIPEYEVTRIRKHFEHLRLNGLGSAYYVVAILLIPTKTIRDDQRCISCQSGFTDSSDSTESLFVEQEIKSVESEQTIKGTVDWNYPTPEIFAQATGELRQNLEQANIPTNIIQLTLDGSKVVEHLVFDDVERSIIFRLIEAESFGNIIDMLKTKVMINSRGQNQLVMDSSTTIHDYPSFVWKLTATDWSNKKSQPNEQFIINYYGNYNNLSVNNKVVFTNQYSNFPQALSNRYSMTLDYCNKNEDLSYLIFYLKTFNPALKDIKLVSEHWSPNVDASAFQITADCLIAKVQSWKHGNSPRDVSWYTEDHYWYGQKILGFGLQKHHLFKANVDYMERYQKEAQSTDSNKTGLNASQQPSVARNGLPSMFNPRPNHNKNNPNTFFNPTSIAKQGFTTQRTQKPSVCYKK